MSPTRRQFLQAGAALLAAPTATALSTRLAQASLLTTVRLTMHNVFREAHVTGAASSITERIPGACGAAETLGPVRALGANTVAAVVEAAMPQLLPGSGPSAYAWRTIPEQGGLYLERVESFRVLCGPTTGWWILLNGAPIPISAEHMPVNPGGLVDIQWLGNASAVPEEPASPINIQVSQNPFRSHTEIQIHLQPQHDPVDLLVAIFNVQGVQVRHFREYTELDGGIIRVPWDGRNDHGQQQPAGVYYACVNTGRIIKKIPLVRIK